MRWMVGLTGLGLLLGVALGYGGPVWFELDLLAHFRPHLLGASVALAGLALVLRARAGFWQSMAAAALAAAGLGELWRGPDPAPPRLAGPGVTLTVMAANLYALNPTPAAMRRMLAEAGADILVTTETTTAVERGSAGLEELYPHRIAREDAGRHLRTVVWSVFPIRRGAVLSEASAAPAGAWAVVEIAPGQEVTVLGLHVANVLEGQRVQIEALAEAIGGIPGPDIVLGDFNATAWSHALDRIEAATGADRVAGTGRTWHGGYPTPFGRLPEPLGLPIDHVLVSGDIAVNEIGTLAIPGSDHLAVRATLRVPG